ncbi:MAG: hypothetical protein DMG28_11075 [Acidobacteria bacterium]|nr:MAG: hypothetical protein DMG28_11075 [Acidobacteriota bacterium]
MVRHASQKPAQEAADKTHPAARLKLRVPDKARILIVCDDDSITERLNIAFREAGFFSECTKNITVGCESARSGRFQVVFTTPVLCDGSWRCLVEAAHHYDLGFEVVLLARTFDLSQWAEALEAGAFDVPDALDELPKAAGVAKLALEGSLPQATSAAP